MAQKSLDTLLTPVASFNPHTPTTMQQLALDADEFEILYGGAAAGGKSDWVLMDAVRYVEHSHYRALIFRRTYKELAAVGGLVERSKDWWFNKASWNGSDMVWTFPSGAKIGFMHMQHEDDKHKIQSIEIHRAYLEECNQFTESQARYVISRIRKNEGDPIPLALRMTSNPGGHKWVKNFVKDCEADEEGESKAGRRFIQARLEDNPHVDQVAYRAALARLDPVTRAMLELGDWDIGVEGNFFKQGDFKIVESLPPMVERQGIAVRYWDLAASEPKPGRDPDYSAGVLMMRHADNLYIVDCETFQLEPTEGDARVIQVTKNDGRRVMSRMEEEGGSSGKRVTKYFERELMGFDYRGIRKTGSKVEEARPWAAAVSQGRVHLVRGRWVPDFVADHVGFPLATHDDTVDASSGAFNVLSGDVLMGQAGTVPRSRGNRKLRGQM